MRNSFLFVHRWVALVTTIFLVVLSITGSLLVFEGALDRATHPSLWHVTPGARRIALDTVIAHARQVAGKARVTGITISLVDDRADVVNASAAQIFVDPFTGRVTGTRTIVEWNRTWPRRLHVLHVSLMAGKAGGEIVAIATAACLFLILTGLILWWPDKLVSVQWSASWKRVMFDLHHASGILAAVVLLVIAGSGVVMHYETLTNAMYGLDRSPELEALDQSTPPPGTPSISADSLYAVATHALPGARVMFLTLSPRPDDPYVAAMRFPEDHTPGGRSRVTVDRYTGAVLLATSTRTAQIGTRMGNAIRSAHTGDLFGKPTEAIYLLAAVALGLQAVSGVSMWWNGRNGRRAKRAAAQSRASTVAT